MGRLYTSYYGNREVQKRNGIYVAVTNSAPIWYPNKLIHFKSLAPGWELTNEFKSGTIEWYDFCDEYLDFLRREISRRQDRARELEWLVSSQPREVFFLSFEGPGERSCRYVFADFLKEYYDVHISEFGREGAYYD